MEFELIVHDYNNRIIAKLQNKIIKWSFRPISLLNYDTLINILSNKLFKLPNIENGYDQKKFSINIENLLISQNIQTLKLKHSITKLFYFIMTIFATSDETIITKYHLRKFINMQTLRADHELQIFQEILRKVINLYN